jgi:hypothetical protein
MSGNRNRNVILNNVLPAEFRLAGADAHEFRGPVTKVGAIRFPGIKRKRLQERKAGRCSSYLDGTMGVVSTDNETPVAFGVSRV